MSKSSAAPGSSVVIDFGAYAIRAGPADESRPLFGAPSMAIERSGGGASGAVWYDCGPESLAYPTPLAAAVPVWSARADPLRIDDADAAMLRRALLSPVCHQMSDRPVAAVVPNAVLRDLATFDTWVSGILGADVPACALLRGSLCCALEASLPTAFAISVGHAQTTIDVISDGWVLQKASTTVPVGGATITAALGRALHEAAALASPSDAAEVSRASHVPPEFPSYQHTYPGALDVSCAVDGSFGRQAVDTTLDEAKRTLCEVGPSTKRGGKAATVAAAAYAAASPAVFVAPDGTRIMLEGGARLRCAEELFADGGIATAFVGCKNRQADLFQAKAPVLLSGASVKLRGFADRLQQELSFLDSTFAQQRVAVSKDPEFATWRGAALVASTAPFQSLWITREAIEEEGIEAMWRRTVN
jgi:hypothetical protein